MSNISFHCPHCNYAIDAPAEWAGQTVACPGCKKSVPIPTESGSAESATPKFTLRSPGSASPVQPAASPAQPEEPRNQPSATQGPPKFTVRTPGGDQPAPTPSPVEPKPAVESAQAVAVQPIFAGKAASVTPILQGAPSASASVPKARKKSPSWLFGVLGALVVLAAAGGGYYYWLSNKQFRECGENLPRYAAALKCYQDATGRNPWEVGQLEKYLGEPPKCPHSKSADSYVLSKGVEGEVLLKGISEKIPVLLCVHGNRAHVLYEDGSVREVRGKKVIQSALVASPEELANREAFSGGPLR